MILLSLLAVFFSIYFRKKLNRFFFKYIYFCRLYGGGLWYGERRICFREDLMKRMAQ